MNAIGNWIGWQWLNLLIKITVKFSWFKNKIKKYNSNTQSLIYPDLKYPGLQYLRLVGNKERVQYTRFQAYLMVFKNTKNVVFFIKNYSVIYLLFYLLFD